MRHVTLTGGNNERRNGLNNNTHTHAKSVPTRNNDGVPVDNRTITTATAVVKRPRRAPSQPLAKKTRLRCQKRRSRYGSNFTSTRQGAQNKTRQGAQTCPAQRALSKPTPFSKKIGTDHMTSRPCYIHAYLPSFSVQQRRYDGATHAYPIDLGRSPPPPRLLLPLPRRQQRIQCVVHPRETVSPLARADVRRGRQQAFGVHRSIDRRGERGNIKGKQTHNDTKLREKEVDTYDTCPEKKAREDSMA